MGANLRPRRTCGLASKLTEAWKTAARARRFPLRHVGLTRRFGDLTGVVVPYGVSGAVEGGDL